MSIAMTTEFPKGEEGPFILRLVPSHIASLLIPPRRSPYFFVELPTPFQTTDVFYISWTLGVFWTTFKPHPSSPEGAYPKHFNLPHVS